MEMTVRDTAEKYKRKPATVYRWISLGLIETVRDPGGRLWCVIPEEPKTKQRPSQRIREILE